METTWVHSVQFLLCDFFHTTSHVNWLNMQFDRWSSAADEMSLCQRHFDWFTRRSRTFDGKVRSSLCQHFARLARQSVHPKWLGDSAWDSRWHAFRTASASVWVAPFCWPCPIVRFCDKLGRSSLCGKPWSCARTPHIVTFANQPSICPTACVGFSAPLHHLAGPLMRPVLRCIFFNFNLP